MHKSLNNIHCRMYWSDGNRKGDGLGQYVERRTRRPSRLLRQRFNWRALQALMPMLKQLVRAQEQGRRIKV